MKRILMTGVLVLSLLSACGLNERHNLSKETERKLMSRKSENKIENTGEKNTDEKNTDEKNAEKEPAFLSEITYSNLRDRETRDYVRKLLIEAGVKEAAVDVFFREVEDFNRTVADESFVAKGFQTSKELIIPYNQADISEAWNKAKGNFIGNNCRITTFSLLDGVIRVEEPKAEKDSSNLFLDKDSVFMNPNSPFNEEQMECFTSVFSNIKTEATKDIRVHLEKVKDDWKRKKISFSESAKASMISVFIHSAIEGGDDTLFIGHVGVLLPLEEGGFLFVEKLSFDEPYQVIKFKNKVELNDCLMNRYDVEWNQPTAPPFIMENGELMEGYRRKPTEGKN